jgi:transcription termination factor Rho
MALPEQVRLDDLHSMPLYKLVELAGRLNLRYNPDRNRHHLIVDLLRFYSTRSVPIIADGVLEMANETYGFLRWPRYSFKHLPEDVYVSPQQVRQFGLKNGHRLEARIRSPREREKYLSIEEIRSIEGIAPSEWREPKGFDALTAMFPNQRIVLENNVTKSLTSRAVDLICPLGRGQRALIVAPPRVGKTVLMKEIAKSIRVTSPETHLILLLVDERPEEVTDFRREVDCDIFASTFDESPARHVQVAELVSDRAKRLVELKKHVIIMLDSITRLSRGYNNMQPGKGRIMSGGVDSKALIKPKKFFGAARNVEEGGSLTVIATALVETQSRMDDVIFEEFKGTGNAEMQLERTLAERRIFPALHILNSATRREELLYHPQEFERIQILRKQLAVLPPAEAMEVLLKNLRSTRSNMELILSGLRTH